MTASTNENDSKTTTPPAGEVPMQRQDSEIAAHREANGSVAGNSTLTMTPSTARRVPRRNGSTNPDDLVPRSPTTPVTLALSKTPKSVVTSTNSPRRISGNSPGDITSNISATPATTAGTTAVAAAATVATDSDQQQQTLECDYDTRPTDLYRAIESKKWDVLIEKLEGGVWKQQAATWVTRKETNGQLRWRLLPIHAAIIFQAPSSVIEALLEDFGAGASAKDDQGMLPLHLALRNKPPNFAILEELLTIHPAAAHVKDRKGRTPLQGGLAAMKDSDTHSRATLHVLQLYTQIVVSQEKTKWNAEQSKEMETQLQAAHESHLQRWTTLKSEFEREYTKMVAQQDKLKQEYEDKLQLAAEREAALHIELTERKHVEQAGAAAASSAPAETTTTAQDKEPEEETQRLRRENAQLHRMVQQLLDRSSSTSTQLDSWQQEQKRQHERQQELLVELQMLQKQAAATDFVGCKLDLTELSDQVAAQLSKLYGDDDDVEEKKEDNNDYANISPVESNDDNNGALAAVDQDRGTASVEA